VNHIGSEELRRCLGPITHRAAAGETFHVTRRGKPFVVLSPAGENVAAPSH
jgi:antitoxin (DNA-binding transcriptional repressor) of toxin-antitoxin stability system